LPLCRRDIDKRSADTGLEAGPTGSTLGDDRGKPATVCVGAGVMRIRSGLRLAVGAVITVASISRSDAQVIPTTEFVMPPWNAQQVFQPTPLPQLTDPDVREQVAPEDTPVKNRFRPEYQPRGIRYGAWMFHPMVGVGSLYDSNVFATTNNPQGDVAARVNTGLSAQSLWERHGIDLRATTESTLYANHSGLNQTDASLKGTGHYDVDHSTSILGAFQAAYLHEGVGSLNSPTGAVEPTPYTLFSADLTGRKEFGRLTGSLGARIDSYDYGSTVAQNGTILDLSAQDGQIYTLHSRLEYAFSDKSSIFAAAEGNSRNLEGSPGQPLSSTGYRLLSGFALQITHLIVGEFGGGYMSQRFDDPTIGLIAGPTYEARLTWSPSRVLDVHFNAQQLVTEASLTSSTGILANAVQLGFDYEIRPNIVFSTVGTYETDSFKGEDRFDKVVAVNAQLKYLMNNVTSLSFQYRYFLRDSSIETNTYAKHQVEINATARF
jgi:hypothetical protein